MVAAGKDHELAPMQPVDELMFSTDAAQPVGRGVFTQQLRFANAHELIPQELCFRPYLLGSVAKQAQDVRCPKPKSPAPLPGPALTWARNRSSSLWGTAALNSFDAIAAG